MGSSDPLDPTTVYEELDAVKRDVGRLGEALGHLNVARPESCAVLMRRWTLEVEKLRDELAETKALLDDYRGIARRRAEQLNAVGAVFYAIDACREEWTRISEKSDRA